MRIYRFDPGVGRTVDSFGSVKLVLSKAARLSGNTEINCAYLGPGGRIGYHQAAAPQLFLVVRGLGTVRAEGAHEFPISPGQAAFWERGEWHEASSEFGLVAIVIEGDLLDPAGSMPLA